MDEAVGSIPTSSTQRSRRVHNRPGMPSDLGLRSTIGLGLIGLCTAVVPSVAPNFAGMIPNPRGGVVVPPVIAVEDGGSPLSDGVRATAEALDVTGGGGGPGVAHEACDVLQGPVAPHEQCADK